MSVIKIRKKKHDFTIIDNTGIKDPNLSWKAKGLLCYLLSLPDDWQIFISDLKNRSTDGRDSTASGIAELIKNNYATQEQIRLDNGQFGYEYTIYEVPQDENRNGFSVTAEPLRLNRNGKPDTTKEDKSSTEKEKTKKEITKEVYEPAKTENNQQSANAIPKAAATDTKSVLVQTNNEYRLIDTPEELTDVTEQVIIKYAESLKKDFERRGFVAANARDYAIEFANQFFKTFKMCSLKDEAIKRKLAEWAFIFAKVNTEIAQAQKAVNMTLPPQYKTPTAVPTTKKNLNLLSMLD